MILRKESLPSGNRGQVGLLVLEAIFSEEMADLGLTPVRGLDGPEGHNN